MYDGFEKLTWTMPTKVFGKSLELHPGLEISESRLLFELKHLGYTEVDSVSQPGQFSVYKNQISFHPRIEQLDYPSLKKNNVIIVYFSSWGINKVVQMSSMSELPSYYLEPILVGRINTNSFEDRHLLRIDEIPTILIDTLIAVEDKKFYSHFGFDLKAVVRAVVANFSSRQFSQGGSTLTQQLVKNFFLSRERTLKRKFTELLMSISLEFRYSKEKILEAYCNEVFLGQDGNRAIHGFGLASWFYFGKPVSELKIIEIATLVATVKGPSIYNPRTRPSRAKIRRNMVLKIMARDQIIETSILESFLEESVLASDKPSEEYKDSQAFIDLVRVQLRKDYNEKDLNTGGLNVHTTFDLYLQESIRISLNKTLSHLGNNHPMSKNAQAAVLVVKAQTGELSAIIGDKNEGDGGFNRAIHARRQVGSMIKPFIYSKALDDPNKFTLITQLEDVNMSWRLPDGSAWEPSNFNGKVNGSVTILDGIVKSLNLATLDLGSKLGINEIVDHLYEIGFPVKIKPFPSILLGAIELSPIELTYLYTMFLNNGSVFPVKTINFVTDQNNNLINQYPDEGKSNLSPQTAALIKYALMQVTQNGTAKILRDRFPAMKLAGKTGTTDNYRDSWFVGFSSDFLTTVWIGHDDNKTTGLSGSVGALQVWAEIMGKIGVKSLTTATARGVVYEKVSLEKKSMLPKSCELGVLIPFASGSLPKTLTSCEEGIKGQPNSQISEHKRSESPTKELIFLKWIRDFF